MKKIVFSITAITLFSILISCKKDTSSTSTSTTCTSTTTISYAKDIAPIMATNCTNCHGSGQKSAGISLHTYSSVSQFANSSLSAIQNGSMPPSGKLSSSDIQKFSCWISQGKTNN